MFINVGFRLRDGHHVGLGDYGRDMTKGHERRLLAPRPITATSESENVNKCGEWSSVYDIGHLLLREVSKKKKEEEKILLTPFPASKVETEALVWNNFKRIKLG